MKTAVQYHLIVNDWMGQIVWYMRSIDGINWKTDLGKAYITRIARYEDGTKKYWCKTRMYERL